MLRMYLFLLWWLTAVLVQEGIRLTVESFSHLAQDSILTRYRDFGEQSKANKLLGNGKGCLIFNFDALFMPI